MTCVKGWGFEQMWVLIYVGPPLFSTKSVFSVVEGGPQTNLYPSFKSNSIKAQKGFRRHSEGFLILLVTYSQHLFGCETSHNPQRIRGY